MRGLKAQGLIEPHRIGAGLVSGQLDQAAAARTALGDCPWGTPWTRRGGNAGDVILVTGDLGGSSLGSHLDFTPRVRESQLLAETFSIHAAIDVSDGLLLDLSRLASDCQCGAELNLDQIPISAAAVQLARQSADAKTSLDHAMSDGEDFELILCASRETADEIQQHQQVMDRQRQKRRLRHLKLCRRHHHQR